MSTSAFGRVRLRRVPLLVDGLGRVAAVGIGRIPWTRGKRLCCFGVCAEGCRPASHPRAPRAGSARPRPASGARPAKFPEDSTPGTPPSQRILTRASTAPPATRAAAHGRPDHPHEHARSCPSVNSQQHEPAPNSGAVLGEGRGLGGEGRRHGFVLVLVLVFVCKLGAALSGEGTTGCRGKGRVVLGVGAPSRAAGCSARCERLALSASASGACGGGGRSCLSRTMGELRLTALQPRTPRRDSKQVAR